MIIEMMEVQFSNIRYKLTPKEIVNRHDPQTSPKHCFPQYHERWEGAVSQGRAYNRREERRTALPAALAPRPDPPTSRRYINTTPRYWTRLSSGRERSLRDTHTPRAAAITAALNLDPRPVCTIFPLALNCGSQKGIWRPGLHRN